MNMGKFYNFGKDNKMTDVQFRQMQEAVANLLKVKDEMAKGLYEMYKAYQEAGFKKKEAMELLKTILKP